MYRGLARLFSTAWPSRPGMALSSIDLPIPVRPLEGCPKGVGSACGELTAPDGGSKGQCYRRSTAHRLNRLASTAHRTPSASWPGATVSPWHLASEARSLRGRPVSCRPLMQAVRVPNLELNSEARDHDSLHTCENCSHGLGAGRDGDGHWRYMEVHASRAHVFPSPDTVHLRVIR